MQRQGGLTLTELMIATALGLMLLVLMLTAFNTLSASSTQSRQLAFLQQNGQLALNLLYNELQNGGFLAGKTLAQMQDAISEIASPAGDCLESGLDSGSFPVVGQPFINLYAGLGQGGRQLNCLNDVAKETEFIQIKRALGASVAAAEMRSNRFYLTADLPQAYFLSRDSNLHTDNLIYPYQHLVLYIQMQRQADSDVPVLMRKRLIRTASGQASISTDSILDGVERLHFEFLIDTDLDGKSDALLPTAQMQDAHWLQQQYRITGIRFYVLLRTLEPDRRYRNNQNYQMGENRFVAPGDHYRRLLLSGAVQFAVAEG